MSPHVMHGFSMADLEDVARNTVLNNRHRLRMWYLDEAIEVAWQGAVEFLCSCEERPQRGELIYAAWDAVRKDVREEQRDRMPVFAGSRAKGESTGKRFQQYWNLSTVTQSHEDAVVDKMAFRQIWPMLTPAEKQVFTCNALCNYDLAATAQMLGLNKRGTEGRLRRARQHFRKLWHQHETPRPMSPKAIRHRPGAGFAPSMPTTDEEELVP